MIVHKYRRFAARFPVPEFHAASNEASYRSTQDFGVKSLTQPVRMAYTGLWREEVLDLTWEDIHFKTVFLHVHRAVIIPNAEPIIKQLKTKKSNRHVPMSDALMAILRTHRQPSAFIITDHEGKLFTKSRYKKFWSDLKEYVSIPDLDARQLRHTYATMTQAAGVEIRTVGACMGHTKSTTTDRYTQVEPTRLNDVRNALTDYVLG